MNERQARLSAESIRARALTHKDLNEFDEAIELYNRAIELDGNNGRNYLDRGYCYREKYHRGDRKASDLRHALNDFEKAEELFSNPEIEH